jgi:hypothetical protein
VEDETLVSWVRSKSFTSIFPICDAATLDHDLDPVVPRVHSLSSRVHSQASKRRMIEIVGVRRDLARRGLDSRRSESLEKRDESGAVVGGELGAGGVAGDGAATESADVIG